MPPPGSAPRRPAAQPALTGNDTQFLRTAMRGDHSEVALAHDVMRHTHDPRAVRFARRMIADHSQDVQKLDGMHGDALANEYLSYERNDHRKDISDYRQELNATSNSRIRRHVRDTLTVLHEHLDLARQLANR